MTKNLIKIILSFILIVMSGCTPGLHTKKKSTVPDYGVIYEGLTKMEAEKRLGLPVMTIEIDDMHYRNIYEYTIERNAKEIYSTDLKDFLTLGMYEMVLSPIDRFKGTKHLMAVVYKKENTHENEDKIISVIKKIKVPD